MATEAEIQPASGSATFCRMHAGDRCGCRVLGNGLCGSQKGRVARSVLFALDGSTILRTCDHRHGGSACAPVRRPDLSAQFEGCCDFRHRPPRRHDHCGSTSIAANTQRADRSVARGCASGPVRLRDQRSRREHPARQDSRWCRSCRACPAIARRARAHDV